MNPEDDKPQWKAWLGVLTLLAGVALVVIVGLATTSHPANNVFSNISISLGS